VFKILFFLLPSRCDFPTKLLCKKSFCEAVSGGTPLSLFFCFSFLFFSFFFQLFFFLFFFRFLFFLSFCFAGFFFSCLAFSGAQPLSRSGAQALRRSGAQPLKRSAAQPFRRSGVQALRRSTAQAFSRSAVQALRRPGAQTTSRPPRRIWSMTVVARSACTRQGRNTQSTLTSSFPSSYCVVLLSLSDDALQSRTLGANM